MNNCEKYQHNCTYKFKFFGKKSKKLFFLLFEGLKKNCFLFVLGPRWTIVPYLLTSEEISNISHLSSNIQIPTHFCLKNGYRLSCVPSSKFFSSFDNLNLWNHEASAYRLLLGASRYQTSITKLYLSNIHSAEHVVQIIKYQS